METESKENIEKIILENYSDYQDLFVEFQSKFLSGLFTRYQSIENGNLVLYFAKETHQEILKKKNYDLNFNLSYDKFWENHHETKCTKKSIIKIAQEIFLPKETARRKILQLIKQKVLNKKNKDIGWLPNEQYKKNYNLLIGEEINDVCKLISFIYQKKNLSMPREEIIKEVKNKFSFYWFHYLEAQLKYLKLWSQQFKDRELILIFLQVAHLFKLKVKKISHKDLFDNPSLLKDFINASISANSVAEATGIPRATCVRKLELLVKLKAVSQDNITKKYYVIPSTTADDLVSKELTEKVVKIFSNFYFICIRAINIKP